MGSLRSIANVADFREAARKRLPAMLFQYIDGGAYDETTLRRNVSDFADVGLRQRVLQDVSSLNLATELFGDQVSMPVSLAPVGVSGMYSRRGEVKAARAAAAAGVPFCLSSMSICDVDEVATGSPKPIWFQLYMIKDRTYMKALLERAKAAGCRVLVFTIDLAVPGARYRDIRTGLTGASTFGTEASRIWQGISHPAWLWDVYLHGRPHTFGNLAAAIPGAKGVGDFWSWVAANFDPTVTWKDIEWLRSQWDGPIVLKGVLDVEDARQAKALGVEGLVVSNHGGRQLDGAMSSIRALPRIVDVVGEEMTVLLDGGVRSGLDVLKALAMGAKGVMLGRAWAYSLAAGGEPGVAKMLEIIRAELRTAMALTCCTDVRSASRALLDG
jgi:L-lactate dehydrogenase (cytochrome)